MTYTHRPRRGRHSGTHLHIVPRAILRVYPTDMRHVGLGFLRGAAAVVGLHDKLPWFAVGEVESHVT